MPLPAHADPEPDQANSTENSHYGNGTRNRNIVTSRSPTYNQGYQHTATDNQGGSTTVQNALCKHVTVCNITQKVIIRKPAKATPDGTETVIQEKATPDEAAPDEAAREEAAAEEAEVPISEKQRMSPPGGGAPPRARRRGSCVRTDSLFGLVPGLRSCVPGRAPVARGVGTRE